jgi:hypothetical protein
MAYNIIGKTQEGRKGYYSATKIVTYFRNKLGYYLVPVHGQYNKYWIRAVYKKGERFDFIDGPKYYKLVVNMNDFGIESDGDLNGWQLAGKIKTQMKEAS